MNLQNVLNDVIGLNTRWRWAGRVGLMALLLLAAVMTRAWSDAGEASALATVNGKIIPSTVIPQSEKTAQGQLSKLQPVALVAEADRLINQELLVQAARSMGLEQQAQTQIQLARARRELLNQVLLIKWAADLPNLSAAQIDRFIAQNPQLFSNRKTFHYVRLYFPETAGVSFQHIEQLLLDSTDLTQFRQKLNQANIESRAEINWKASEQIVPLELNALSSMKDGEKRLLNAQSQQGMHVVLYRQSAHLNPLDPSRTRGAIAQGMRREALTAAIQSHRDSLRRPANIEWNTSAKDPSWMARVNGEEIPKQLLDTLVDSKAGDVPVLREASKQTVTEDLINEFILAQHAEKLQIHKEPAVASSLAKLKDSVLATQLLDLEAAKVARPSSSAVQKHLDQYKELSSKRQVYKFNELLIERPAVQFMRDDKSSFESMKDLADIEKRLDELGWRFQSRQVWAGSEEISAQYREALAGLVDGGHIYIPSGIAVVIMLQKLEVFQDPVDPVDAQRMAGDRIWQEERVKAQEQLLKNLRDQARIEESVELKQAREVLKSARASWSAISLRQVMALMVTVIQLGLFVVMLAGVLKFIIESGRLKNSLDFKKILSSRRKLDRGSDLSASYWLVLPLGLMVLVIGFTAGFTVWENLPRQELPKLLQLTSYAMGTLAGLAISVWVYWVYLVRKNALQSERKKKAMNRWYPLWMPLTAQISLLVLYFLVK